MNAGRKVVLFKVAVSGDRKYLYLPPEERNNGHFRTIYVGFITKYSRLNDNIPTILVAVLDSLPVERGPHCTLRKNGEDTNG